MEGHHHDRRLLANCTFIAFDTETTGLWAPANRIVELAGIRFCGSSGHIETFETLVDPERSIPQDVIAVHGITDRMVRDAPRIVSVLPDFLEFCGEDSILVAHNAPFDIAFIGCELERAGLTFGENLIFDTVDIFHRLCPGMESYSLLSLAEFHGIAQKQEHRALADATLVYELVRRAIRKFPADMRVGRFASQFTWYRMSDWRADPGQLPEEFCELNRAVKEGLRVRISYQTPAQQVSTRIIRPQAVHVLGSRYYINAFCERAQAERTFRLDRIEAYHVLES